MQFAGAVLQGPHPPVARGGHHGAMQDDPSHHLGHLVSLLVGAAFVSVLAGCAAGPQRATDRPVALHPPQATVAPHPLPTTLAERSACSQVDTIPPSTPEGSYAFAVGSGWTTTLQESGDATLALVGWEWSSISAEELSSSTGGAVQLMQTAASECARLDLQTRTLP